MKKDKVYIMALCGLFAAITAVCSWITIPTVVPFTLQTFAVFCTLGALGGQWGTVSVLVYLLVGLAGVPVFAGFSSGFAAFMTPSGGYLIGFLFTALAYWGITTVFGEKLLVTIIAMAAGLLVCYAFGTAWFVFVYSAYSKTEPVGILAALVDCVFPFIIPDGLKIALAIAISSRVRRFAKYEQAA